MVERIDELKGICDVCADKGLPLLSDYVNYSVGLSRGQNEIESARARLASLAPSEFSVRAAGDVDAIQAAADAKTSALKDKFVGSFGAFVSCASALECHVVDTGDGDTGQAVDALSVQVWDILTSITQEQGEYFLDHPALFPQ